jgi:hypothetical protein
MNAKFLAAMPFRTTRLRAVPANSGVRGDGHERPWLRRYRSHNAPPDYKFRASTSGQKRRMTPKIKRELRRRSAVEAVIGHLKSEHPMAEPSAVRNPRSAQPRTAAHPGLKSQFFTAD